MALGFRVKGLRILGTLGFGLGFRNYGLEVTVLQLSV